MMAGWMNRQQQRVIEYLVEENRVLREQLDIHAKGKRIRFNAGQRRRLAEKGRRLRRKVLMEIATLVTPETIYAWHRKFVAMKFAPKGRDHSAAHARREARNALIIKLATENAGWGYTRIQGVMQSLGWHKLSTSTIGEVLREAGIRPSPERGSRLDWKTFIRIHADQLAATDFFTVPVWTLRGLVMYRVHFVIDLLTRKVEITHIGCQYTGDLMLQIARGAPKGVRPPQNLMNEQYHQFSCRGLTPLAFAMEDRLQHMGLGVTTQLGRGMDCLRIWKQEEAVMLHVHAIFRMNRKRN
ncbi:MAG: hypothetical protein ACFBZ8_11265 [Opitutales bacterium]